MLHSSRARSSASTAVSPCDHVLINRDHGSRAAILDDERVICYSELCDLTEATAAELSAVDPGLVLHLLGNDLDGIVGYLAAFESSRPIALVDGRTDSTAVDELVALYRPRLITGSVDHVPSGYAEAEPGLVLQGDARPVHPDLAVLLRTSGSTGSPKFVRLSRDAVLENADSIIESLGIDPDDRAPANLPLFYSYGLSVLNSHLRAGAAVFPTDLSFMQRAFWNAFDELACTSLAGVPYSYEMLRRLRFDPAEHPTLRSMTQAGGKLADTRVRQFHAAAVGAGVRFFVMYGQTEATARMAVLPPDALPDKLGSAGRALPRGRFEIVDDEVVYEGPNVMMGYAQRGEDLGKGDDLHGRLRTGDLGRLDDQGFLWLTGRANRIGKVYGVRVSLDDVEALVGDEPAGAVADGDRVVVFIESAEAAARRDVARTLAARMRLPVSGLHVRSIERLPRRASGKVDYSRLQELL
jgi:acyl-CoA synthetase (AMP-forming)/AMP-acid ligase II